MQALRNMMPWSLLFVVALLAGCCKAVPKSAPLGTIDLSTKDAQFQGDFVCPKGITCFSFVLSDTNGSSRAFCESPNWPIAIQVDIVDKESGQKVMSRQVTRAEMQFNNWHLPATSVGLSRGPWLQDILKSGRSYQLTVSVLDVAKDAGIARVFMEWLE